MNNSAVNYLAAKVDFAPIIAPVLEVLNALLWPCIAIARDPQLRGYVRQALFDVYLKAADTFLIDFPVRELQFFRPLF